MEESPVTGPQHDPEFDWYYRSDYFESNLDGESESDDEDSEDEGLFGVNWSEILSWEIIVPLATPLVAKFLGRYGKVLTLKDFAKLQVFIDYKTYSKVSLTSVNALPSSAYGSNDQSREAAS